MNDEPTNETGEEENNEEEAQDDTDDTADKDTAPASEEEEKVEVPDKFKDLVEAIEQMPVLDLAELVKVLEKKLGVSAAVAAAPAAAGAAGDEGGGAPDSYTVMLTDAGSSKIQVIKAVKDITGKGLKEAKEVVDGAPVAIAENVAETEANDLKAKLEEAGATVELK